MSNEAIHEFLLNPAIKHLYFAEKIGMDKSLFNRKLNKARYNYFSDQEYTLLRFEIFQFLDKLDKLKTI